MPVNPYRTPAAEADIVANNEIRPAERVPVVFPIIFVLFTLGVILPLLFSVGKPFFGGVQMSLPLFTQAILSIPPLAIIGASAVVSIGLVAAYLNLNDKHYRMAIWIAIAGSGFITLIGTLAFLSPLYGVASGMGR